MHCTYGLRALHLRHKRIAFTSWVHSTYGLSALHLQHKCIVHTAQLHCTCEHCTYSSSTLRFRVKCIALPGQVYRTTSSKHILNDFSVLAPRRRPNDILNLPQAPPLGTEIESPKLLGRPPWAGSAERRQEVGGRRQEEETGGRRRRRERRQSITSPGGEKNQREAQGLHRIHNEPEQG